MIQDDNFDLFDALTINTREDSYTSIIAYALSSKAGQEQAKLLMRDLYGFTFASDDKVSVNTRLYLRQESSYRKFDVPDIVVTFGDPIQKAWVIEAKIKSLEGHKQLERYESKGNQEQILAALKKADTAVGFDDNDWIYTYLTLDGNKPITGTKFKSLCYKTLCKYLPEDLAIDPIVVPAYTCLLARLNNYYSAKNKLLFGDISDTDSIADLLCEEEKLVDIQNNFHWLSERSSTQALSALDYDDAKLLRPIVAQGKASANPGYQIRLEGWKSEVEYDATKDMPLWHCHDVHLELQLESNSNSLQRIRLVLHYETNPYMTKTEIKKQVIESKASKYEEHRQEFKQQISNDRNFADSKWTITNYPLQLAKYPHFDLANATVSSYTEWLKDGLSCISSIDEAVKNIR